MQRLSHSVLYLLVGLTLAAISFGQEPVLVGKWAGVESTEVGEILAIYEAHFGPYDKAVTDYREGRTRQFQPVAAQTTLPQNRTAAILRERDSLRRENFNLAVGFSYESDYYGRHGKVSVGATVPAQFPHSEFDVLTTLDCTTGEWEISSPDQFALFLEVSGAEHDGRIFRLDDIEVTCSEDGLMSVRSARMLRTMALLDWAQHRPLMGSPDENRFPEFISFTVNWDELRLNNPSIGGAHHALCCSSYVRISESNMLDGHRVQVLGIDVGDGLRSVIFEGQVTPQPFDPNGVNRIYVNSAGNDLWDYLTFDIPAALITWQRTTTLPR